MNTQKVSPRPTRVEAGLAPILIAILIALGVGGYLVYTNYSNNRTKVTEQTAQPSPVSTTDEIANWKTYTNAVYNFSFVYPQDWMIGERKLSTNDYLNLYLRPQSLTVGDSEYGVISVIVKKSDLEMGEYIDTLCGDASDGCDNSKKTTELRLGNLVAKRVSPIGGALPIEAIAFKKGNYIFQFNMILDSNAKPNQQNLIIRDQMLSTFKFTQ